MKQRMKALIFIEMEWTAIKADFIFQAKQLIHAFPLDTRTKEGGEQHLFYSYAECIGQTRVLIINLIQGCHFNFFLGGQKIFFSMPPD